MPVGGKQTSLEATFTAWKIDGDARSSCTEAIGARAQTCCEKGHSIMRWVAVSSVPQCGQLGEAFIHLACRFAPRGSAPLLSFSFGEVSTVQMYLFQFSTCQGGGWIASVSSSEIKAL